VVYDNVLLFASAPDIEVMFEPTLYVYFVKAGIKFGGGLLAE
jgi:hypothetical protein